MADAGATEVPAAAGVEKREKAGAGAALEGAAEKPNCTEGVENVGGEGRAGAEEEDDVDHVMTGARAAVGAEVAGAGAVEITQETPTSFDGAEPNRTPLGFDCFSK